jgi:iron complex transport system substrate-binding protein
MMFAIGAGDRVVGVVEYSDYPPQAKQLPQVGGYIPDLEKIVSLHPDLIIAWKSGNPVNTIDKLKNLGLTVYLNEANKITDIPAAMEKLGTLTGTAPNAKQAADKFRADYLTLQNKYTNQSILTVFYQIWDRPLMTINGKHLISDVMNLCGGKNIFENLNSLAPMVSVESVLSANPDVIVASGSDERQPIWLKDWRRWPKLKAVEQNHLFVIPPDLIQRPGPRILTAAKMICEDFYQARQPK